MRDFVYDLRRTLSGKFTIITIALIVIISALLGYVLTSGGGGAAGGTPSIQTLSSYTYSNDTYNVSIYAFNQNGQPAPTLPIFLQYNGNYANITTESDGFAHYTIHSNLTFMQLNYSTSQITSSSSSFSLHNMELISKYSPDAVQVELQTVTKAGTTNSQELLLYYSPTFVNQTSNTVFIYYTLYNRTGSSSVSMNIPNMTYYSQVTVNAVGTQLLYINPANRSALQGVVVSVFPSNNSTALPITAQSYIPQNLVSTVGVANFAFQLYAAIFGIFIPLLASLSAYFYFGKDRASGVLESVITRPVTKGRIILSRYIANVSSLTVAFAIGVAVFDLFLYRGIGSYLTTSYAGSLIWSYFVEIAAFTGLIYIASLYLRSQGAILGVAIGLFLVFALFWTGIIEPLLMTYVFHVIAGTNAYQQLEVYFYAINPASYGSLMAFFISPTTLLGVPTDAAKFGVTQISVAAVGLIWFLIPIILAFTVGRRRD